MQYSLTAPQTVAFKMIPGLNQHVSQDRQTDRQLGVNNKMENVSM